MQFAQGFKLRRQL